MNLNYISQTIKLSKAKQAISPFWLGFVTASILGIITHFVLPSIWPNSFENGITKLLVDPHYFHNLGLEFSNKPWSDFTFRPEGQFPAGVLAFLYKIFSVEKPWILIPVLASLTGLTMAAIVANLEVLGVTGRWWPILISFFFTVTPTSISWMVYPHKDAYIVPGVILLLWAFISVTLKKLRYQHFMALLLGSILVFSSKPYFAELFLVGLLISAPFAIFQKNAHGLRFQKAAFFLVSLGLFAIVTIFSSNYSSAGEGVPSSKHSYANRNIKPRHRQTKESWVDVPGGKLVNKALFALSYTRERFLYERAHGSTNFLPDFHIANGWDAIRYIPRAMQLSLLEPLPWRPSFGGKARKAVFISLQFEMLFVYASILFLICSGKRAWKPSVIICFALALPFLLAFGFAVPNIGTVNRYRFPFLIILKMAGFAALWNADRMRWPGRLLMWVDPPVFERKKKKVLFLVPDDATFVIQRLVMAQGVQSAGFEVHVACPDLGHGQKIRELGFTFHQLDLNRGGLNPFADFLPFCRLVFFLAKERPDILQCVSIKPVIYGATAGTIVGLRRIVCLVNGLGYAFEGRSHKGKIVRFVAKSLYRNALAMPGVRVIFQNPDDQNYFIDSGIVDKEKTLLIRGSGVNMEKFYPTPLPENGNPVFLFVGRLLWSKGIRELVEAALKLKEEGLQFTLRIVGAPDERNPEAVPLSYLKEYHDRGVIEWLGRQTDMPKFYRESDIITLPTAYREGLPLTLLEAASTGRPLISTDMPGCREIVRDGENGFLVPPQDANALADAMRKLIQNPELRKKFGEASAEIVRLEFSSQIVQQKLLNVYEGLLSDSPRAAISSVISV
jgi:glycosyltransferase involved in cell wall biosynthesis